jgi:hypothetical protein
MSSFRPILYAVTALQGDDFPLRDNLTDLPPLNLE